jgi:hypothetical protein
MRRRKDLTVHTLLLVVGEEVDRQLEPHHQFVLPREVLVQPDEIEGMSEHYGLPASDTEALLAKIAEYFGEPGALRDGKLYRRSNQNPDGKFDWYRIGGRWEGFLRLSALQASGVSRARKSEIDHAALLADPPGALLFRGEWRESPISFSPESLEPWCAEFARAFAAIPDGEMLTVVDIHS